VGWDGVLEATIKFAKQAVVRERAGRETDVTQNDRIIGRN